MNERHTVRIESAALPGAQVQRLHGHESLSQLFRFELFVVFPDARTLDAEKILATPAELVFDRAGTEVRRVYGEICEVRDGLYSETELSALTLTLVPRAFRLGLAEASEVFLGRSIPEIVKEKLGRVGLQDGKDLVLRLLSQYASCEHVVQYKETDLAFVSRLTENLGIAFSFEHRDGRDVIVFSDDNSAFLPVTPAEAVAFYPRGETMGIHRVAKVTRTVAGRCVVRDYNYRTPKVDVTATSELTEAGSSVIEYGGNIKTPEEAERLARVRAQEIGAQRTQWTGKSDVAALRAGGWFRLDGHAGGEPELLVVEVHHHAEQTTLGTGTDLQATYSNEFKAIERGTPYRPPRRTPKPRVHGAITGIVEAAAPSDYAEVDGSGRYHVRFMFDSATAPSGEASHPIRMAQPHAGPGYGFHFPLRHGVEVALTCIDGDPDRPIISGALPNPLTPTTVAAANSKRNVIRTGGGNEIDIDDTEGSERIKLTSPFGNTVLQLGAPNAPVPGVFIQTGQDAMVAAKGDVSILSEASVTISAATALDATAPSISVQGGPTVDVGADQVALVGRSLLEATSPTVVVHGSVVTVAGAAMVVIRGTSVLQLESDGSITVKAPKVNVSGDGTVNVDGGAVNVTGSGNVAISGSTVKLNC